jgi:hypothetical protein
VAAEDSNILSWNVANWISVTLMAAVGIAIFFAIQKFVLSRKAAASAAS